MKSLIVRWLINIVALRVTVEIIPGINGPDNIVNYFLLSAVFTIIYIILRPIMIIISAPIMLITIRLFIIVINALILLLTAWLSSHLSLGLTVEGFVGALIGAISIGLINSLFYWIIHNIEIREINRKEKKWLIELEKSAASLKEQGNNWQRTISERESVIKDQIARIKGLKKERDFLIEQNNILKSSKVRSK